MSTTPPKTLQSNSAQVAHGTCNLADLRFTLVTVQVQVLYFGILKDLFAREGEPLDLTEGALVGDAIRLLRNRASKAQGAMWSSLAVAVNREYASRSTVLHDADELALLPPVSGGSPKAGRSYGN